jgi:hypothetical protein
MATAVEHLVTGETMQISTSREQRRRLIVSLCHDSNCSSHLTPKTTRCGIKMLGHIFFCIYSISYIYPMSLFVGSDMILIKCAVWNTTCRRHTTKQHH